MRLALFAASPVHYYAPLYRRIAADRAVEFTAIFASSSGIRPYDAGYGRPVTFDRELTRGYRCVFLRKADANPTRGRFWTLCDPDVVGLLLRGRYDVLWLHGYNSATHAMAALAQRVSGGRLLVREDQTLLHRRSLGKTLVKEVGLRAFFANVSALYVGSQSKLWFEHYGVPGHRLFFTPHCVDNERLQAAAARLGPRRATLQERLGVSSAATPVIVTVSRLVETKRTALLLEAFKRVRSQAPCTLLIVGSGQCEPALRRTVREHGISDVVFTGFLDQATITQAYASADIFALFSGSDETWGLAVNEAMNFGLPVVVSDKVGCAADLVQDGRNGFVVPSGDVATLADRLATLVRSAELRRSFGAESLKLIAPWNYERAAQGVLDAAAAAAA